MSDSGAGQPSGLRSADAVAADYRERSAEFSNRRDVLLTQANRLSYLRLVAFVAAAAFGLAALDGRGSRTMLAAAAIASAIAFAMLAGAHRTRRGRANWEDLRRRVCERGALRVARAWTELGPGTSGRLDASHPYAADLDVTGPASLERLLDVTTPDPGHRTLSGWLLDPSPPAGVVRARQRAMRALVAEREWRETLTAHAWAAGGARRTDVARFLEWSEGEPWLRDRRVVVWAARVLALAILPIVALAVGRVLVEKGVMPPVTSPGVVAAMDFALRWWTLPIAISVALTVYGRHQLSRRLAAATAQSGGLGAHAAMLAHVQASSVDAPALAAIRRRLETGRGAARELARLGGIVRWAEARYSPMAHVFLRLLLLWDFHVLDALERWQAESGAHARDWLAALGEAEALSALATLGYDNPDWSTPEITEADAPRIEARALAHPLLASGVGVPNDITLGPAGTFVLVTGSNMSGKSTLLRAIGTNVVLAQAGGPVCAESLRLPLVDLWTSIRIDDSLEAGISLFMAELKRLKRIVDAARDPARSRPLVYLLDEMLHGTNTAERRIAARTVLTHLIHAGAFGAVTTHDLTLAEDPSLDAAASRVHFTERFEQRNGATVMTFDYRLRPGLATSANALALLRMIGLGPE